MTKSSFLAKDGEEYAFQYDEFDTETHEFVGLKLLSCPKLESMDDWIDQNYRAIQLEALEIERLISGDPERVRDDMDETAMNEMRNFLINPEM